jgi:hypothetical protein
MSLAHRRGGGPGKLPHMPASKAKALPTNANVDLLAKRIQTTVDALQTGPADSALIGLALVLARSIDEMDAETRGRMLGQTSGALLHVLRELRVHAPAPRMPNKWDELRPGAVAARGIGGR